MKESKKRRQKQPGKLMAKFRSQPINLPGAWPLMNPLHVHVISSLYQVSDLISQDVRTVDMASDWLIANFCLLRLDSAIIFFCHLNRAV